ncbi:hypothetical protein D7193_24470 [Micromonospora costi]|uniref:Uncharacterized protein n=1 Tax=Micromonospora costi TaxID=1530042 RepID=A0A3A9ZXD6_9ACTN|nr:hypothetical protein D7193_24470 [Micromonospora costi]
MRRDRWWPVAAALIMAVFTAAFYTGLKAFPETVDDFVLPGVLLVMALLGLIAFRRRVVDRGDTRREELTVWASVGLALVTILLNRFVLPDGLTPWVVLVGLLPAAPFLLLAWRITRR